MFPQVDIVRWRAVAPWADDDNVEQDLVITLALFDIFRDQWPRPVSRTSGLNSPVVAAAQPRASTSTLGLWPDLGRAGSLWSSRRGGAAAGPLSQAPRLARAPRRLRRSASCHQGSFHRPPSRQPTAPRRGRRRNAAPSGSSLERDARGGPGIGELECWA